MPYIDERDPRKNEWLKMIEVYDSNKEQYDEMKELMQVMVEIKKTHKILFKTFLPFMMIDVPVLSDVELMMKSIFLSAFSPIS